MTTRHFTDAEEQEIEKIYRMGGFSLHAIAEQYHSNGLIIQAAVRRAGGKTRTREEASALRYARNIRDPRMLFTEDEDREIEKIYRIGGFGSAQIARQYPCSSTTIRAIVRRAGGKLRTLDEGRALQMARRTRPPNTHFTETEEKEIEKIYRIGGFSAKKIGRQYHCGEGTIRAALRRLGGKIRTRQENDILRRPNLVYQHISGYPIITVSRLRGNARSVAERMVKTADGVRVHRLVMALHLHRPLLPTEIVHHRDGKKANYHISNLQLLTQNTHTSAWGNPYYQKWQEALAVIERLRARIQEQEEINVQD